MGIDLRIETERGECVAELADPHNYINWLLSLAIVDSTFCLQFIDPYGDTVFNGLQLPVLQSEFSSLRSQLTEMNLAKADYLKRAVEWPNLQHHLEEVLRLLSDMKIPHYYVRFVGD
jgi:hypothetical protein